MKVSPYQRISKQELARSQLEVALRFYMQGEEFPAVITLAGAAEELLGKIAIEKGLEPALKRTANELMSSFRAVWGCDAKESDFVGLRNRARDEMKHIRSGNDVHLDYEKEAAQLLSRALENFLLCTGTRHPSHRSFTETLLAHWRAKQAAV